MKYVYWSLFLVVLTSLFESCSSTNQAACALSGGNSGSTFDNTKHYVCYRPMFVWDKDRTYGWAVPYYPDCDNQAGSGFSSVRFSEDWEDLECDCFILVDYFTKQPDKGNVFEGADPVFVSNNNLVPQHNLYSVDNNGTSYFFIHKADLEAGNKTLYSSPPDAINNIDMYKEELDKDMYDGNEIDFEFGYDEVVNNCSGPPEYSIGCPVVCSSELGRIGVNCPRRLDEADVFPQSFPPIVKILNPSGTGYVSNDYKKSDNEKSKIHPISRSTYSGTDFVFANNDIPLTNNGQPDLTADANDRHILIKVTLSEIDVENLNKSSNKVFNVYMEREPTTNNQNKYIQNLSYNTQTKNVTKISEDGLILKYCGYDSDTKGHVFIFKFKIKATGTYNLKYYYYKDVEYIEEQQKFVVGNIDKFSSPDYPNLASSSFGERKLQVNVLQVPGVTALDKIIAGPYGSFEKTIEDAYSNKNIGPDEWTQKSTPVPNDFNITITPCSSNILDFFDNEGNVKLLKSDYDEYISVDDDEIKAVKYAYGRWIDRVIKNYYNGCNPLAGGTPFSYSNIKQLDVNQIIAFRASYLKFYASTTDIQPLVDMDEKVFNAFPIYGTTTPLGDDECVLKNNKYYCSAGDNSIPKALKRSVVAVFDEGYDLKNGVVVLGSLDDVEFAMVYEASHEILHTWCHKSITDESSSDGNSIHNNYMTGNNASENLFKYYLTPSDQKNFIETAKQFGLVLPESLQERVLNQLVRKVELE